MRVRRKTVVEIREDNSCGEWRGKLELRVRRKTVVESGEENCTGEWGENL